MAKIVFRSVTQLMNSRFKPNLSEKQALQILGQFADIHLVDLMWRIIYYQNPNSFLPDKKRYFYQGWLKKHRKLAYDPLVWQRLTQIPYTLTGGPENPYFGTVGKHLHDYLIQHTELKLAPSIEEEASMVVNELQSTVPPVRFQVLKILNYQPILQSELEDIQLDLPEADYHFLPDLETQNSLVKRIEPDKFLYLSKTGELLFTLIQQLASFLRESYLKGGMYD